MSTRLPANDDSVTDLRASHEALTEKTYRALKELIVTRAFPAGGKVTAEGLSQRFGVSRTTVKGALDQLAGEGLLIVRPQVGTFVRGFTEQDIRDIADARLMLELHAGTRGLFAATDEQRAALRQLIERTAPLIEEHEYRPEGYEEYVSLDRQIHELIVASSGNALIQQLHRQVSVHVHIASFQSRRGLRRADAGLREHCDILRAYEMRDAVLLATTLTCHIERSRDVALQALARAGDVL